MVRQTMQEAARVAIALPVLCEVVWNLSRGYKLVGEGIADAIAVLVEAENVKVNRGAVDAGLTMLRSGGDFADGVIAYEGFALGREVFTTFDQLRGKPRRSEGVKKAVITLKKHGPIITWPLS